jgi:hypothetical protein
MKFFGVAPPFGAQPTNVAPFQKPTHLTVHAGTSNVTAALRTRDPPLAALIVTAF